MQRRINNNDRISGFAWNVCSNPNFIYNINHSQTGVGENSNTVASRSFFAIPSGTSWPDEITNWTDESIAPNPLNTTSYSVYVTGSNNTIDRSLVFNGTQYVIIPLDTSAYSGSTTPSQQYKVSGCVNF